MDAQEAEAEDNVTAARLRAELDEPWQEAFRQAWEAVRGGNIGVGACASTPEGEIIHADGLDAALRKLGEGPVLDLAYELEDSGDLDRLMTMEVDQVLASIWPRLQPLAQVD